MRGASAALVALFGLAFAPAQAADEAADPGRGAEIFQNNCKPCHSVDKGAKPDIYGFNLTLYGILGRPAASVEGFFYSEAMMDSGIVWDEDKVRAFITDPYAYVPETRMPFQGLKVKTDRDDVIAYFKKVVEDGGANR